MIAFAVVWVKHKRIRKDYVFLVQLQEQTICLDQIRPRGDGFVIATPS